MILVRKAFTANWITFISGTWMWSSFSSKDHVPAAVRSCSWIPQPILDPVEGGIWRGTPDAYLSSWSQQPIHCLLSSERGTGFARLPDTADQCDFSCHWKGCPGPALGAFHSREVTWPNTYHHIFAGGNKEKELVHQIPKSDNLRVWMVSVSIMRYWALLECSRSDISGFNDNSQVLKGLKELFTILQQKRNWIHDDQPIT